MLDRKYNRVDVQRKLVMRKGAQIIATSATGTETVLDMTELAALNDIAAADLAKIDGITNGTAAANKALVLGASKEIASIGEITTTEPIVYDTGTTITAFATGGQASATALTAEFNNVTTCATASDSVKLPVAAAGKKITVKNSGATALAVFPATGDAINALAVNLSVDIAVNGQMTFRAIDATTWETEEFLISQAPSTQKGSLVVKAADSAGNTVTTITNASQAAARTYTIPDAGAAASFMMTEGAQTINGVQTTTLPRVLDSNTTITAFATGGQASATALTGEYNTVTVCATAGDSVKLPAAVAGQVITVRNIGAAICAVFPASGDAINALAADLSISLPVLGEITFQAVDGTTWYTNRALSLQAPTTQRGNLIVKVADNAANYEVAVVNASHGQATVHTIPDPGAAAASFVLTEGTQTINGAKTIANISSLATAVEAAEHGAGSIGTSSFGAPKTYRWIEQGIIITQTKFDLTGLASVATVNDVIGLTAGGAAFIGRNVEATNGVIFKVQLACLETPTVGDNDVNVVANASATLVKDDAGGTTYLSNSGDLLKGQTIENLLPALTEGDYFYLTAGTGDTAGTYTAGMYVLTTYGHAVLA